MATYKYYGQTIKTTIAEKASATVIAAKSLVALDAAGLIIPAVAASTAIGYAPNGAVAGVDEVEVAIGNDFSLVASDATRALAKTDRGELVDIDASQDVNLDASVTGVLQVTIAKETGDSVNEIGSDEKIGVVIAKPLQLN